MILTETQSAIQASIRAYAQEKLRPRSRDFETAGGYPAELFAELAGRGLMGMVAPEEEGGAGADYVSYALVLIEIAAADGALSTILSIQNSLIISALLKDGTPAQKKRLLPELIDGKTIGAFALTETDAGSDASAIRTRAVRATHRNDGWVLNGSKQFITSGKIGRLALIVVVTEPEAGKKGFSTFLVPTDRQGYFVDKVEYKLGQAASNTCALRFENMFIEH